jgi:prolipoprotein diacylglyceryltransferase
LRFNRTSTAVRYQAGMKRRTVMFDRWIDRNYTLHRDVRRWYGMYIVAGIVFSLFMVMLVLTAAWIITNGL